jgi:hypothetical protein
MLYILRRWTGVDLGPVMDGLRTLHTLEVLAVDQVHALARADNLDPDSRTTLTALHGLVPGLRGRDRTGNAPGLPLITDTAALRAFLSATPIVHPIFARLFWYRTPFNDIEPIGVGDLKWRGPWREPGRFPCSLIVAGRRRSPAIPPRHRHGYAADLHRGLPNRPS